MTTITKLKNALAALEAGDLLCELTAAKLLRSVIAEMEAGEPVAWMITSELQDGRRSTYPLSGRYKDVKDACDFGEPIPLYTHPQPKAEPDDMRNHMSEPVCKAEPVQCLDCGSNNLGVLANYDSVVKSVVNQKMTTEESSIIGYATHHEEPMLFPTKEEALQYCDFDEEPIELYAAPQVKPLPLTDDRIWELAADCLDSHFGRLNFARAIEAAHGIGGGK